MSKRWAGGSTRAWRKIRLVVLQRDAYRCQLKRPGCTTVATHVHHTSPREIVGDDPAHLVAACARCNQSIGDPTKASAPSPPVPRPRWL